MSVVLGIMGHFCSGKSYAASFFRGKGFLEIDLDHIGKEALIEKKKEITACFGEKILDENEISPKKLGAVVFEDETEIKKLNQIVHPWMVEKTKELIHQNKERNILLHAAILIQIGLKPLCNYTLYIDAPLKTIVERGIVRNQFSREKIKTILKMQKKNNAYSKHADFIIKNNDFEKKLNHFYNKITEESNDDARRQQSIQ